MIIAIKYHLVALKRQRDDPRKIIHYVTNYKEAKIRCTIPASPIFSTLPQTRHQSAEHYRDSSLGNPAQGHPNIASQGGVSVRLSPADRYQCAGRSKPGSQREFSHPFLQVWYLHTLSIVLTMHYYSIYESQIL